MSTPQAGTVTVKIGAISEELQIVGQTVCQARQGLKALYNISDDQGVSLNGADTSDDVTLRDGDELVFGKSLASKG